MATRPKGAAAPRKFGSVLDKRNADYARQRAKPVLHDTSNDTLDLTRLNAREQRREDAIEEYALALACRAIRHAETIIEVREFYVTALQSLMKSCKEMMAGKDGASVQAKRAIVAGSDALIVGINAKAEAERTLELVNGPTTIEDVMELQESGDFSLKAEKRALYSGGGWGG